MGSSSVCLRSLRAVFSAWLSAPNGLSAQQRLGVLWGFAVFSPIALFMDSVWLSQRMPHGQWITLVLVVGFFVAMQRALNPEQRLLALVFVPVGALGEYVFSLVFGLYEYRLHNLPIYVPVAHPILLSMGWVFITLAWVQRHTELLRKALLALHTVVLLVVVAGLGDTVSGVFSLFAIYIFRRRHFSLIYGAMGLIAFYVEILGTAFGCWAWAPVSGRGWLHATNPPYGAFIGYVAADVLVLKLARSMAQRWLPELNIARP